MAHPKISDLACRTTFYSAFALAGASWIVLLAGVAALQEYIGDDDRATLGLPWWIVSLQFVLLVAMVPTEVLPLSTCT